MKAIIKLNDGESWETVDLAEVVFLTDDAYHMLCEGDLSMLDRGYPTTPISNLITNDTSKELT